MKFSKNSPMTKQINPEHWTDLSLAKWLDDLPVEPAFNTCEKLLAALEALDALDLTRQLFLHFLSLIDLKLDVLVEQLEKDYRDAGVPLDPEEQIKSDLVTQLYTVLGQHYCSLGQQLFGIPGLAGSKQTATVLYLAFQSLSKVLLNASMTYRKPYEGFWLNCYQTYQMAEKAGLLNISMTEEGQDEGTISSAFKHILLFELANTAQFRPREIKMIYQSLENDSSPAEIETRGQQSISPYSCMFNLKRDEPPQLLFSPPRSEDSSDRFFSPLQTAKNLHHYLQQRPSFDSAAKTINRSVLTRAIKTLSLSQRRKSNRNKEQLNNHCVVGFIPIASYLYKLKNGSQEEYIPIAKKDPRIAGNWDVPNYDLVPKEDSRVTDRSEFRTSDSKSDNSSMAKILQVSHEHSDSKKIWDTGLIEKNKLEEAIPNAQIEIIDSSAQGFQILWKSRDVKVKLGEIIALLNNQGNRVHIGLVRRINISNQDEIHLGVEMIGVDSEAVRLIRPGRTKQMYPAIFLPGISALKRPDSIIYSTSEFSTGEFVNLERGKNHFSCRLIKQLDSTAAITHMELYYAHEILFSK